MNIFKYILTLIAILPLAACGGGGDGDESQTTPTPTAKTVTLKLATSGTPSTNLAGITITVILPDGVTPPPTGDDGVIKPAAVVSGVAAPGSVLTPIYTPANGTAKGTLKFALASSIVDGFGAGEYATVTLSAEVGVTPALTDFDLTGFIPIDVNGREVAELSTMVTGVNVP